MTEDKKAIKKTRSLPNKVRFKLESEELHQNLESIASQTHSINLEPTFPYNFPTEIKIEREISIPRDNLTVNEKPKEFNLNGKKPNEIQAEEKRILKVYLENQTTKSFVYDSNTQIHDVLQLIKDKLNIKIIEYFGLCITLAVISVGKNNNYGHPSSEVLDILKAKKIKVWRTDKQGELVIHL